MTKTEIKLNRNEKNYNKNEEAFVRAEVIPSTALLWM